MADDDIADIIEHTPHKRNSVFTPLVTLKAFIFQVLGDDSSCKQAVVSVLADRACDGKSANSVNTGPYCKARKRLPLAQMKAAATNTGSRLHQLIVLTGILLNNALQALFKAIASTPVGLQKRKNQPRAIKRCPKPYSLLMIPRHEACAIL